MTETPTPQAFKPSPVESLGDTAPLYLICGIIFLAQWRVGATFACFVLGTTLWLYRWTTTFVAVDQAGVLEGKFAGNRFRTTVGNVQEVKVGRTRWTQHGALVLVDGSRIEIPASIAENQAFRRLIPVLQQEPRPE